MTITAVPERREQQRHAISIANRVRAELRDTRAWLREPPDTWDSRDRCAELLTGDPVPALCNIRATVVVGWCRGLSERSAERLLRRVDIPLTRTVGRLTPRQCFVIAGALRHGYHDQLALSAKRAAS